MSSLSGHIIVNNPKALSSFKRPDTPQGQVRPHHSRGASTNSPEPLTSLTKTSILFPTFCEYLKDIIMSSQWVTKTQYHKLTESSDSMSDEEQPLQRDLHSTSNVSKRVMLLISTASFLSGLCAAVLLSKLPSLRASTSYEAGFITDIGMYP